MQDQNPYALSDVAAVAATEERMAFLQRTYALLLAGVFTFAATMWAAGTIPAVNSMMVGLWETVSRGFVGLIIYFGIFYGGAMAVHALAAKRPLNLVAYFGYAMVMGLLVSPITLWAADNRPTVLHQAAIMTLVVFGGLTGYVFVTKKDFSFLSGVLNVMFWAILGATLLGFFFGGFSGGYWISMAIVVFFALYILYDTSAILHRYPTNMHVSAACVLFVDVIMLFKHLLFMLMHSDE